MTKCIKLIAVSFIALTLSACASHSYDVKSSVDQQASADKKSTTPTEESTNCRKVKVGTGSNRVKRVCD